MTNFVKQGKRNKQMGLDFERRTRAYLEELGYIVTKWHNNVKDNKLVPAKAGRFRQMQTGFPDFFGYIPFDDFFINIFVECKVNGRLSKEEKEKVKFYLENYMCNCFYVASKEKIDNRVYVILREIKRGDLK